MSKAKKLSSDELDQVVASAQPKPKRKTSKVKRGPTEAEIREAMRKAAQNSDASDFQLGAVIGLDREQWQTKIIPLDLPSGRIEQLRMRHAAEGWTCEPDLQVSGMNLAEVWVMPMVVWKQTIFARQKEQNDIARDRLRITDPVLRY